MSCTETSRTDDSASIFTKKAAPVPVADKGWKEGEPWVAAAVMAVS